MVSKTVNKTPEAALHAALQAMENLVQAVAEKTQIEATYLTKWQAAEVTNLHTQTLYNYRKEKRLIQDVHYIYLSRQHIRYHRQRLLDWVNKYGYDTDKQLADLVRSAT